MPTKEQLETEMSIPWDGTPDGYEAWQKSLNDLGERLENVKLEQGDEESAVAVLDDGVEVTEEEYIKWNKVDSVPFNTEGPVNDADSDKENGQWPETEGIEEFLNVFLIGLGDPEKTSDPLLALLDTIFSTEGSPKMRLEQLRIKFGIEPTEDLKEGIDTMYRISEVIRREYSDELEKTRKQLDAATQSAENERAQAEAAEKSAADERERADQLREQLLAHGIQPAY